MGLEFVFDLMVDGVQCVVVGQQLEIFVVVVGIQGFYYFVDIWVGIELMYLQWDCVDVVYQIQVFWEVGYCILDCFVVGIV